MWRRVVEQEVSHTTNDSSVGIFTEGIPRRSFAASATNRPVTRRQNPHDLKLQRTALRPYANTTRIFTIFNSDLRVNNQEDEIWNSHGGHYDFSFLIGCSIVLTGEQTPISTVRMDAVCTFETRIPLHQHTQCHISQDIFLMYTRLKIRPALTGKAQRHTEFSWKHNLKRPLRGVLCT